MSEQPSAMPDLFAKVGPLPAWGWGALVILAYLGWTHFHSSATPAVTDTTSVPDTSSTDATANDPYSVDPQDAGYNYSDVLGGTYGGSVGSSGIAYNNTASGVQGAYGTNQAWAMGAIEALIHNGVPASTATTAITLYLAGQPLAGDQSSAVGEAIQLIGPPPLPLPLGSVSSVPLQGTGMDPTQQQQQQQQQQQAPSAPAFTPGPSYTPTGVTSSSLASNNAGVATNDKAALQGGYATTYGRIAAVVANQGITVSPSQLAAWTQSALSSGSIDSVRTQANSLAQSAALAGAAH